MSSRCHRRRTDDSHLDRGSKMIHLEPATRVLAGLVQGVRDEQLTAPTPCTEASLGDLIDHVDGLSLAFTAAATKTSIDGGSQAPSADASRLGTDWRTRVPERLATLASAWREEAAWVGMAQAGGRDLPARVAGVVALNEVIVHGWDIAVASGQSFRCEPHLLRRHRSSCSRWWRGTRAAVP